MSELAERLNRLQAQQNQPCPVTKLFNSLDKETSDVLKRVMDGKASTREIHSELTAAGYRIGRDTIAAHRNGWCRCQGVEQ
jgi:hypothetical protein